MSSYRAERLTKILLKREFDVVIRILLDVFEKLDESHDSEAVGVIKKTSRLLIPWLYVASVRGAITGEGSIDANNGIITLPAGHTSFAEIVMAGLDRRATHFRQDGGKFPDGHHRVSRLPPGGIANTVDDYIRNELSSTYAPPSEYAMLSDEDKDWGINEQIAYIYRKQGVKVYFICPPTNALDERQEWEERLRRISKRYPDLGLFRLDLGRLRDHHKLFNEIRDLLLPEEA